MFGVEPFPTIGEGDSITDAVLSALDDQRTDTWSTEDLAVLSPYLTARIQLFEVYATDEIPLTPEAYDAHLGVDLAETA